MGVFKINKSAHCLSILGLDHGRYVHVSMMVLGDLVSTKQFNVLAWYPNLSTDGSMLLLILDNLFYIHIRL